MQVTFNRYANTNSVCICNASIRTSSKSDGFFSKDLLMAN